MFVGISSKPPIRANTMAGPLFTTITRSIQNKGLTFKLYFGCVSVSVVSSVLDLSFLR